jgi:hypothetical protein
MDATRYLCMLKIWFLHPGVDEVKRGIYSSRWKLCRCRSSGLYAGRFRGHRNCRETQIANVGVMVCR